MRVRERVAHEIGDVWLLVNNAGVFLAGPFLEMSAEQCAFLVGVNLWGSCTVFMPSTPGRSRDGGYVVNTSSVDGIVTVPHAALYVAAKHAVTALGETFTAS